MATTGKPRTTFVVSYGQLGETAAQAALAPVLIAPRYELIDKESDLAVLGSYTYPTAPSLKNAKWPGHTEDAIVDVASCEFFVRNAIVQLNDAAISASIRGNKITVATGASVKTGGTTELSTELNGADVMVGDVVRVHDTDGAVRIAEIVDIRPTYTAPTGVVVTADNATADCLVVKNAEKFGRSEAYTYLVTFNANGSDASTGVSATITALAGDIGYIATTKITSEGIALSGTGVTLALSENASSIVAGQAVIVKLMPKSVNAYNEIYVSNNLGNIESADVFFATGRLSGEYLPLSTAMWDATEDNISISDIVSVVLGDRAYTLVEGEIRVAYRELLTDGALQLFSCATDGVADIVGKADPRNPMGMMYACASQVTGGFFYMLATAADTEEAYVEALEFVGKYEQCYAPVCAMQTSAVQAAALAVINKYSSKEIAKYKRTWFAPVTKKINAVYSADASGVALIGSIKKGVLTLGGTADAIVAGVRGGDVVRVYQGSASVNNTYSYDEYVVATVTDATKIELTKAVDCGISRVEFFREISSSEYAKALAKEASSIASHRANFVASDKLMWGDFYDVDGCYLAATLATLRSSLPPHAPMNELVVPGFTVLDEYKWRDVDYEEMNAGGVWLVYANDNNETVTYHQITTVSDGSIAEEDSAVSNGDAIVRVLRNAVRPIASGKANVSAAILNLIDKTLRANIEYIMGMDYSELYGPQIQDYTILSLYIPEGNRKSIRCKVRLQLPLPLQDGEFEFNLI
jgi:hypothetical protein